ncbi:hypothetical protein N0V90_004490 [Kalmusia sp. IMI 367209]|nr:hypothetical protein N0V90_004490 [Kalmusia sp. IMI 367209]
MGGKGNIFVARDAWKSATTRLVLISSFGGVQAFQPFAKKFGSYNPSTKQWALPAKTASLMNSLPLIGKFIGTLICGPMIEKLGHRTSMFITCFTQIVGVVIQCTSHGTVQYTAGRIVIYLAVGLVENVVPTYQAEIAPAPLRGFFVGSIQLFLTFGSLIAGIINNEMAKYMSDFGWVFATAFQAVPGVIILCGLPFTPNSPRWLVQKDRANEAEEVLRKLRTQADNESGLCVLELTAMCEETQIVKQKDPWSPLFKGTNFRRTKYGHPSTHDGTNANQDSIAISIMALQQLTGVTFSSTYGPTFYKQEGLGNMAFTYAAINNGVSVVTAIMGMVILDMFGRRSVSLWGNIGQGLFLFLIGGLGAIANRSTSDTQGMVASFIIYAAILHMTLGPAAYITASEVGKSSLREKTMSISTAVNVVVSFVVVFTTPYLLNSSYAGLGPRLGFVWGGCAVLGAVWVWFCMPELKGRNLEEIDELFEARLPAWRFEKYETTGISHDIGALQGNHNALTTSKNAAVELRDVVENNHDLRMMQRDTKIGVGLTLQ